MSETTQLREAVRQRYAAAAQLSLSGESGSCCGTSCCSDSNEADPISRDLYDGTVTPSQAALSGGVGCGNPTSSTWARVVAWTYCCRPAGSHRTAPPTAST